MAPYQPSSSAGYAGRKRELPSGYASVQEILAQIVAVGKLVNVIGLVKDYQAPIPTKGSDYKCTITLYDKSIEYDLAGLAVNVFRHPDEMSKVPQPRAGDVLVISSAKVQSRGEGISLVANKSTSFHIYSASDIPRPPQSAKSALKPPYGTRQIGEKEHEYVSWLYHHTNKDSVPDVATFQRQVDQSIHMKDKFCRLEDVVDGKFCDIIVHVVKTPFDEMDKTTLWVSDYTENDSFYKFSWNGAKQPGRSDGDSYGYFDADIHAATKWAGPFGRRSMQVTCFEPHASRVNSQVQLGEWIRIRNLRIKFGNNGLNLEGVLHEDRDFTRQQVDVLNWDEREVCDPRLKEAIRRKIEYDKLKKKQLKNLAADEGGEGAGTKRKADNGEELKDNAKSRRKEKRGAAMKKVEEQDKQAEERLGLNNLGEKFRSCIHITPTDRGLVKCESREQPVTPLSSILEPVQWKTTVDGEAVTLTLPFACAKYRTIVRVVDFRPRKLENFATWRKSTESDVLSDYSSDSASTSGDDNHGSLDRYSGKKIWEWRYALQLEDVNPKSKGIKDKFWAVVDNIEAQQLTGLDACNLREDPDMLNNLREQLFKLWGNLEEAKMQEQQRQITNQRRVAANQPPPSSPAKIGSEFSRQTNGADHGNQDGIALSNKPFACCVRQYGVRVREPNPRWADAGDGYRWVRAFGLFGTKICK
ncbi:hypothetical protein O1611_g4102 [Lasiodiplodia mahajangana]|uniref:Uncharacterized protein n=1 Tax=Lasiodiplodia mahajangana TaxID=1108764 RepID=A0ACC2JPV4_9PEZI|nr:hypothetical protein O1611_g4102 [Lasiodiplodia mahajangana]